MESFELGKEIEKDIFASCHERGTKEKFWVPMRNRTSDLQIPRFVALLLIHRDSTVRDSSVPYEVYYEVHMTSVLYTARISNVDSSIFVNIIREMVSVELGKERMFLRLVTDVGQRKNSEFPWGIDPQTLVIWTL